MQKFKTKTGNNAKTLAFRAGAPSPRPKGKNAIKRHGEVQVTSLFPISDVSDDPWSDARTTYLKLVPKRVAQMRKLAALSGAQTSRKAQSPRKSQPPRTPLPKVAPPPRTGLPKVAPPRTGLPKASPPPLPPPLPPRHRKKYWDDVTPVVDPRSIGILNTLEIADQLLSKSSNRGNHQSSRNLVLNEFNTSIPKRLASQTLDSTRPSDAIGCVSDEKHQLPSELEPQTQRCVQPHTPAPGQKDSSKVSGVISSLLVGALFGILVGSTLVLLLPQQRHSADQRLFSQVLSHVSVHQ